MLKRDALKKIEELKCTHPSNLAVQCFELDEFSALSTELQERLLFCMSSGLEIPESETGFYASQAVDYSILQPYLHRLISRHHGVEGNPIHHHDWSVPGETKSLNLSKYGLPALSIRMRVGRNFKDLPLPSAMSFEDRSLLEQRMEEIFDKLTLVEGFEGRYHSLTPGHEKSLSTRQYKLLQEQHIIFKDMSKDAYLNASGISNHWPHGRGCYLSNDHRFIVWVGEEDHLRIIVMLKTQELDTPIRLLEQLTNFFGVSENLEFASNEQYGFITSCPSNLGTAMRASVHLPLPRMIKKHAIEGLKSIGKSMGLAVRGVHGEHSNAGQDGVVDISPSARLWVTEGEIIRRLYEGIGKLHAMEQTLNP